MAVTFDAVSSATPTPGSTSPHTWTHTGVGSSLAVVAAIVLDQATSSTTVTCTYGGASMTLIGAVPSNNANNGYLYFFGILSAPTGAQTVSFTFSGTTDFCVGASLSWTGAAGFGAFQPSVAASSFGSAANPGLGITTTRQGSQAFCAIGSGATAITSMGGGAQRFLDANTGTGVCSSIVGSNATGTGGVINFTSVIASAPFAIGGLEILPPPLPGPPPQPGGKIWRRRHRRIQPVIPRYAPPIVNVNAGENPLRVGAFLNPAALGYTSTDWTSAASAWTLWTGQPVNCARHYMAAPPYAISSDMTAMIAGGTKILISLTPAFNPTSSTQLAQIETFMRALIAAGANCDIALWSEPFFSGLTSTQYIAGVQFYGPTIRRYYPLVFNTANGAVVHDSEATFYPGDAWVDKVGTDYYASGWVAGDRLDTIAAVASGASPPKPLALWELNGSPASTGQSQANVDSYFAYLTSFLQSQQNSGFPVGDLCLFNGAPGESVLGAGTTENGGFEGGLGNWTSGSGAIGTTSAVSHSGTSAASITSSGAGAVNIISCTVANVTTQGLACTSGDAINAACWLMAQTTPRAVGVNISYYTSGGVLVSTTTGPTVTSSATVWTQATLTDTAPATSAFCRLIPVFTASGTGEVHFADDPELRNVQGANPNNTTTIEFGWDYRIALWQSLYTAFNGDPSTSTPPGSFATALDATITTTVATSVNAGVATATATAQNAVPAIGVDPTTATATGTAKAAAPAIGVDPSTATATGTARSAAPAVGITAGVATATGAALAAVPAVGVTPGTATATATAQSATPAVGVTAGVATATGTAQTATVTTSSGTNVNAGTATATGTAQNVVPAVGVTPAAATATGTAKTAAPAIGVSPTAATATGTAKTATPAVGVTPAAATATGAALAAVPAVGVATAAATATGAALDATVSTSGGTSVNAGTATATGAAQNPTAAVAVAASAVKATATGVPLTPALAISFSAGFATAAGTAQQAVGGSVTSPPITVSGFGSFPQVPSGAIITAVIANITVHGSDVGIIAPAYQLWDGASAQIGVTQNGIASTSASHFDSVVFTGVVYSQLATLQLRIFGVSGPGNSGATVSVDAASLSVEWLPIQNATATPGTLSVPSQINTPEDVEVGVTIPVGVLNVVPALPAPTAGFQQASATQGDSLTIVPSIPTPVVSVVASQTATASLLAVVPGFPAPAAGLQVATATPSTLQVSPSIPTPAVGVDVTATASLLAVVPGFPAPTAGFQQANASPGDTLNIVPFIPTPLTTGVVNATATATLLAVVPVLPAIISVTAPGWAAADSSTGWTNPNNILGPPDGSYAVWTVP